MADMLDKFRRPGVNPNHKSDDFENVIAYEEAYMKLLKKYQEDIDFIQKSMQSIRNERESFYLEKLPAMKAVMSDDTVAPEVQQEWIEEITKNTEKSLAISESLIEHYVTKNLEEFKYKLKALRNKV